MKSINIEDIPKLNEKFTEHKNKFEGKHGSNNIRLLCDFVKSDGVLKARMPCLDLLSKVTKDTKILSKEIKELIKNTYLFLSESKNDYISKNSYEMLMKLRDYIGVEFTSDDIMHILDRGNKFFNQYFCNCFHSLIYSPSGLKINDIATKYLDLGLSYPLNTVDLIDLVESDDIRSKLIDLLFSKPDLLTNSEIILREKFLKFIEAKLHLFAGYNVFLSLTRIILYNINSLRPKLLESFLKTLIERSKSDKDLIKVIKLFNDKLPGCPHTGSLYLVLLDFTFNNVEHEHFRKYLKILSDWTEITHLEQTKLNLIFQHLSKFNYDLVNVEFLHYVDNVFQKNPDFSVIKEVFMNILSAKFPNIYSRFFYDVCKKYVYDDDKLLSEFVNDLLINIPIEKSIYIITSAIEHEADFMPLDHNVGFKQEFIVYNQSEKNSITINLHPFHSIRRVYYGVSHFLKYAIGTFELLYLDEVLPMHGPLSIFDFSINLPVTIVFKTSDNTSSKENINVISKFTEILNKREFIDILASHVDFTSEVGQLVAYVLTLLDDSSGLSTVVTNAPANIDELLKNYSKSKLLPFILKTLTFNKESYSCDGLLNILNVVLGKFSDSTIISMACFYLRDLKFKSQLATPDIIQRFLFDCEYPVVRETVINNFEVSLDFVLAFLPYTSKQVYRSRTKEFFSSFNSSGLFAPFEAIYKDLDQYEMSYNHSIDFTYIELLKKISHSPEMIQLTINRLFSAPECLNMYKPFVHTSLSWKASYDYLMVSEASSYILDLCKKIPSVSFKEQLDRDFDEYGTTGIVNMGNTCYIAAILQVLHAIQPVFANIVSNESNDPFFCFLKELLLHLEYVRGMSLTIDKLFETFPTYTPEKQEDAEEFLMMVLERLSKISNDIVAPFCGMEKKCKIEESNVISKDEETSFKLISIYPKKENVVIKDIYEGLTKYFEPERISDGFYIRTEIVKWPDILTIKFMRWEFLDDYSLTKTKDEIKYPFILEAKKLKSVSGSEPEADYHLAAVIAHRGTVDIGHYIAFVRSKDNDWYKCDDTSVTYFPPDEIPEVTFGSLDEENTHEAYLLFYMKSNLQNKEIRPDEYAEKQISHLNTNSWPSVVFFNEDFSEFIRKICIKYPENLEIVESFVIVFFRIIILETSIIEKWSKCIIENLSDPEAMNILMKSMEMCPRESFSSVAIARDESGSHLSKLFCHVLNVSSKPHEHIMIIIDKFSKMPTKKLMNVMYECITNVVTNSKIQWLDSKADTTLFTIMDSLTCEMSKECIKPEGPIYHSALTHTLSLIHKVLLAKGKTSAVQVLFDEKNLSKYMDVFLTVPKFIYIMKSLPSLDHKVFMDSYEHMVRNFPSLIYTFTFDDVLQFDEDILNIDTVRCWYKFPELLFSSDDSTKRDSFELLYNMVQKPDYEVKELFTVSMAPDKQQFSFFVNGSGFLSFVVSLMPSLSQGFLGSDSNIKEIILSIIKRISFLAPCLLSMEISSIDNIIKELSDKKHIYKMLVAIHNLIVFDPDNINNISNDSIRLLLSIDHVTIYSIHILYFFKNIISSSQLYQSCINYYLRNVYVDNEGKTLINLLKEKILPDKIDVPSSAPSVSNIIIVNSLIEAGYYDDKILSYLISALNFAHPLGIYIGSKTFKDSLRLLEQYGPEYHQNFIKNVK